ncbi:MAG: Asp-tRNA(Asn)/Glu-tRNA(Gln) amidotransferase subunit GatA [Lachnospiraceae bacterium]|nr:Asp-tRNA(Asn)/Glu-tRNA(Gln) amidotransferase subunit GatA [Lachnospiraceae bacterium]
MQITERTALELGRMIKNKEISVREAVDASYQRIAALDGELNSYVTLDQEAAYARADQVQAGIEDGSITGPLAGVPAAIKDNICTEGLLTTCSSKILYNFVPTYSAEAVLNMEKAGAVILGKTNMDEFAMGSTTETSAFGPTKNPWNTGHVPGGSSGGSCAAVAAGEALYALGSDTGGSIRQPGSFCGVVGLKPTYGTVSRYGLIAYGSSLDQIGPIAKDVSDCAAILEMIASHDKKDSTSVARTDCDFTSALVDDVKELRVGIPSDYLGEGLDDEVRQAVLDTADVLRQKGAIVEEFDLSLVEYAIPAYYVIASAEASSNLSRFDGVKYGYRAAEYEGLHNMYKKSRSEGFGEEVKRRIMLGSFVLSSGYYDAYYLKALRTKALIKQSFDRAFEKYDIILAPASPTTAPELGKSLSDPLKMYLGDIYTISVNLAGLPGISVPCRLDSKGLPIGVQMIGDCFNEKAILRAAYAFEQARGRFLVPEIAKSGASEKADQKTVKDTDALQKTAADKEGE